MAAAEYELGEQLGGSALRAARTAGGLQAARVVGHAEYPDFLAKEGAVLRILRRHPHSVLPRPIDARAPRPDGAAPGLVVFPAVGKDLHAHLWDHRRCSEAQARHVFKQLAAAVAHAHRHRIVLRDLKLGKIFFKDDASWDVVIGDVATAQCVPAGDALLSDQKGSPAYVSPEVLTCLPYDGAAADLWGLGVILFVLLTGTYPFQDTEPTNLFVKIQKAAHAVRFPPFVSDSAKSLISSLLTRDPTKRPPADQLLQHPWVAVKTPPPPRRVPTLLSDNNQDVFESSSLPSSPLPMATADDHVVPVASASAPAAGAADAAGATMAQPLPSAPAPMVMMMAGAPVVLPEDAVSSARETRKRRRSSRRRSSRLASTAAAPYEAGVQSRRRLRSAAAAAATATSKAAAGGIVADGRLSPALAMSLA